MAEYTLVHLLGAIVGGTVTPVAAFLVIKGLKSTKPASTLTVEVANLKSNCQIRHAADDKRFLDLKKDLQDGNKGVQKRMDDLILVIKKK